MLAEERQTAWSILVRTNCIWRHTGRWNRRNPAPHGGGWS